MKRWRIQKSCKTFDCDIEAGAAWHSLYFSVTVSEGHRCLCPARAEADGWGGAESNVESLDGFLGPVSSHFSSSCYSLAFGLSRTISFPFNKAPFYNLDQIKLVSTGCNQKHLNIYNCKCLCLPGRTMSFLRTGILLKLI